MARRHLGLVLTLAALAAASGAHAAAPVGYGLDTQAGGAGANDIPLSIQGVQMLDVTKTGLILSPVNGGAPTLLLQNNAGSLNIVDPSGVLIAEIGTATATQPASASGQIFAASYLQVSDARLKTNIKTAPGLDVVEKLRGVSFDWKSGAGHSNGVLAQDVEKVLPSAVRTASDGSKSVEYSQLMGPMIEAIKELKAENDDLRKQIAAH